MIYIYHNSRTKNFIENASGISKARWRIFNHPIKASVQNAEKYVMVSMRVHNYLRQT